jgi:hypothetical protein
MQPDVVCLRNMDAHIYIPKNELREAIDYIWYHEADAVALKAYNIPFLHREIIINFGAQLFTRDQAAVRKKRVYTTFPNTIFIR